MADVDPAPIERLERRLGRALATDVGSCPSFDHLSESNVLEIETLAMAGGMIDAILYVRLLIRPAPSLRNAMSFVELVGKHQATISEWFDLHYRPD